MANACPFRFSTKYQDDETDLLYYGFRYYSASTGRWLSRDPIGERGGLNAFGFVQNDPVAQADVLGLQVGSANPSPSSWTEASAVQELNGYVTQWKQQGWDYAAAGLAWFANDNHSDWNSYIYHDKVANDSGWKKAFTKQIKSEVDKLPNGNISFGEEDMKNWSEGMSFEWDHHQYFKDRFTYTFGNSVYQTMHPDNELFFALHGSHYNYYGFACKQDAFYSVRVTILLWDPFAYPSPVGAYVDTGYDAARYLQNTWDYGRGADGRQISQYAVWIQKFSNIGQ